jgi:hypothetical protein
VVWEGYPLKKDYTWEPIENLYGHEDLVQTYDQWLKTENERLDSQEVERKTERQSTAQKVQDRQRKKSRMHPGLFALSIAFPQRTSSGNMTS